MTIISAAACRLEVNVSATVARRWSQAFVLAASTIAYSPDLVRRYRDLADLGNRTQHVEIRQPA